jgi:hypothetical protein
VDILAIVLACSLHADDRLVTTLVDVQSGGNPFFVGDLTTLKTNDELPSAADALRFAESVQNHGGRPAVGLLGVPFEWAARYGRAPIELFDACTNISVGTAALADYYQRCRSGVGPSRSSPGRDQHHRRPPSLRNTRYCVVRRLAAELGVRVAAPAILDSLVAESKSLPPSPWERPPQRSPLFSQGADWQSDDGARMFLQERTVAPPVSDRALPDIAPKR